MGREIKFRAWFKPTHEYKCEFLDRYNKELPNLDCRYYTEEDFLDDTWRDTDDYESIIFEQYTGLKDKNGKEIYEGDILREEGLLSLTYVMWDDICARYLTKIIKTNNTVSSYFYFDHTTASRSEVIGNIHENGKLLGGEE